MARVMLNGGPGMRLYSKPPSNLSDDDVQSGSATGFSDGDFDDVSPPRPAKRLDMVDPVTRILDKIDAELSSLTVSQASSSTATDSTVVRRPPSRTSTDNSSKPEMNGDGLSLSELGHSHKPTFSPRSSGSRRSADTGIGTGNSSYHDDSHHQRSSSMPCRDLEPGDNYKGMAAPPPRRSASPEMAYMNGHHQGGQSDDDKSKQGRQTGSQLEAKLIDDKFREIMQKRKGGFLTRASTDDDNQTIRTEDFCDKFQDTLVYTSDEGERLKNLEDDLHSDGGSDTDTLQQKLATLTRTPLPAITDGRSSPHPLPRPVTQRPRRGVPPPLLPKPKRLVTGPGTPPVYPKPTPTSSFPRPSSRSPALKLSSMPGHGPGHASDADSVQTEDFENRFSDMMVSGNQTTGESDLDTIATDPIHTKVKQLLKATAKYDDRPYLRYPVTSSILKSRLNTFKDKPKPEHKSKQHVRISPQPPQYQGNDKGEDSDETIGSDKEDRVPSPRTWSGTNWLRTIHNPRSTGDYISPLWTPYDRSFSYRNSKSSSFEDSSLSKSSLSLTSLSSLSSSDKDKQSPKQKDETSSLSSSYLRSSENCGGQNFSRQVSQISSTGSGLSSITDYPGTSRSTSTSESMFDDIDPVSLQHMQAQYNTHQPKEYEYSEYTGATRRRSSIENLLAKPYTLKNQMNEVMLKKEKHQKKKQRDLIVQEDEEEEYPFAKYTFNKKRKNSGGSRVDDTGSVVSTTSCRSSSQDSICSVGMMNQYSHLQSAKKPLTKVPSSASFVSSSMTSSMAERAASIDDMTPSFDSFSIDWKRKHSPVQSQNSSQNVYNTNKSYPYERSPPSSSYSYNNMYNFPQRPIPLPVPSPEQVLSNLGFTESQNFLPERFLRSWLDKVILSQQEEFMRRLLPIQAPPTPPVPQQSMYYNDQYFIDDNDLPPSVSAQQSGRSTPRWRQSMENIHSIAPPPPRSRIEHRKLFRRSHTMSYNSQGSSHQAHSINMTDDDDSEFSRIGPLPLQKENSFDKLKRILQTTDVQYRDRDSRRTIFASSRQQSLPLFLETLSEEEEERRRSRTPSFDKKNGKLYPSKMKTFLEEEELHSSCRASSSEDVSQSDSSRRSSFTAHDPAISSMLNSVRESLSAFETTDSNESDSTTSSHSDRRKRKKEKCVARKHSGINIPSIVVSERDIFNNDDDKLSKDQLKEEKHFVGKSDNLPPIDEQDSDHVVIAHTAVRPASPTPGKSDENIKSKDSLEIIEIMNKPDKKGIQKIEIVPSLETTKLTSGSKPSSDKRRNSGSNKFLTITAEQDEKLLSPTPSTASPVVMSPVTVIEVNRLDNQNDSLDFEEAKTCDSVDKLKIIENQFQPKDSTLDDIQTANKLSSRLSSLSQTPKSLSLERRSYEHDPNCDSESSSVTDTEDVFVEQLEDDVTHGLTGMSVQTENEGLTPLIKLSEMSTVLSCLFAKLPMNGPASMYYLAQDKGVQCQLPIVSIPKEEDCTHKKEKVVIEAEVEKVVIEAEVENNPVSVCTETHAKEIATDPLIIKCMSHICNSTVRNEFQSPGSESFECQVSSAVSGIQSGVCHCANNTNTNQKKESYASGQLSYVSEVIVYPKICMEKVRSEAFIFVQQFSTAESENGVKDTKCKSKKAVHVKEVDICHGGKCHVEEVVRGHGDECAAGGHLENMEEPNEIRNICTKSEPNEIRNICTKSEPNEIRNICTKSDSNVKPDVYHELDILSQDSAPESVRDTTSIEKQYNQCCTMIELARDETNIVMETETIKAHTDVDSEKQNDIEQKYKVCHSEIMFSFGTEPSGKSKSKETYCDIAEIGSDFPNGESFDLDDEEPARDISEMTVNDQEYDDNLYSNHFSTTAEIHEQKLYSGYSHSISCNDEADIFEFTPVQKPCAFHSSCDEIHLNLDQAKLDEKCSSHMNIIILPFKDRITTTETKDPVAISTCEHDEMDAFEIPVVKVNHISDNRETGVCDAIRVNETFEINGYHEPLIHEDNIVAANRLDGESSMSPSVSSSRNDADVNGENTESEMPSVNPKSDLPHSFSAANSFNQDQADSQNKESYKEGSSCKTWKVDKTSTLDSWSSDGSRTIFNSEKEIRQSFSDTSWTLSAKSRSSEDHESELNDTVKEFRFYREHCDTNGAGNAQRTSEDHESELSDTVKEFRFYREHCDTNGDGNAQQTSKSLDFDARGMRRSIFQRCKQSVFGQTFDIGTDVCMEEPFDMVDEAPVEKGLDITIDDFTSLGTNPSISSAFKPVIQRGGSQKETSEAKEIGSNPNDGINFVFNVKDETSEVIEIGSNSNHGINFVSNVKDETSEVIEIGSNSNHGINFVSNVKERFLNGGIIEDENVMYQVGLKYNKDKDCMDVFGRIQMERSSSQSSTDIDEIAREHLIGQKRNSSGDELNSVKDKHGTVERNEYFDIFKQIDDGHFGGADVKLAKYLSEPVTFRKYSCDEEDGFREDSLRKSSLDSASARLSSSCSEGLNNHGEYGNILAELDREIQRIDAYNEQQMKYSEIHRCKNCGHSLTIATSNKGGKMVEHDYCRECSPLDLTAEMLERRRLEKMEQCTHS